MKVFTHRKTSVADDGERRAGFSLTLSGKGKEDMKAITHPFRICSETCETYQILLSEAENSPGHCSKADILHENRVRFFFPSICAMVA